MKNILDNVDNTENKSKKVSSDELSKIAHELKNCLTTISGYTQLVLREIDETFPFYEELKVIERESKRCNNLIYQCLNCANNQINTEPLLLNLHQIIEDSLILVYPQVKTKRINVIKEYASVLPKIKGHDHQLKQVMINILDNALEALNDFGELHIKTEHIRNEIILKIRDSGLGILDKHLSEIFNPFFTTKPFGEGTGLGLTVAQAIVKQHKGYIRVESKQGYGTTFHLHFPAYENEQI